MTNDLFSNWRKYLTQLVKISDKKEWESLDVLSKWFISTRSAVGTITIYSGIVAGLLAWQHNHALNKPFDFLLKT